MYPFLRLPWQMYRHRSDAPLGPTDTHHSRHICWPWDLDFWNELNNGRTLTLYDLGRLPMSKRMGVIEVLKARRWGITVAGSSVRYRRRVRAFDRIEMKSRVACWDHRFLYMEQSMWVRGECTSHVLIRSAFTSTEGIVAPQRVIEALGRDETSPPVPDWIAAWIEADAQRPWPPMQNA